jgi:hypothetical protein
LVAGIGSFDANAISFHFGVKLAVCGNASTAAQVGGGTIEAVRLTKRRDSLDNFTCVRSRLVVSVGHCRTTKVGKTVLRMYPYGNICWKTKRTKPRWPRHGSSGSDLG